MRSARVPAVLIVFALAAAFSPSAGAQSTQQPGTVATGRLALTTNSPAAKEEFWRGLEDWQSGSYTSAQRHFRRAAALDNGFALARVFATGQSVTPAQVAERDRAAADAARQSTEEGVLALFWREKALGHPARSRVLLRAAMQLMPNEPGAFAEYLWSSQDEGVDSRQTLDSARAFRARFPNYAPMILPIPFLAMSVGDTAGALRAADEYTRIAPRAPASFGYYGSLLQQLGRYDDAEAQYRKGMALLPIHADYGLDPASALAELYELRGRNADARAVATEALARVTESGDSAMYLAEIAGTYFATGDNRRGTQLLEQAREKSTTIGNANNPDRPDAILAEANAVFGDGRSLSSFLARLHAETPVDSAVDIVIHGLSYGYAGKLDSAMAYSDRLANNTSVPWRQPWAHRLRGVALATAKQCERARTELMQADTSSIEVLMARADCEQQLGNRAAALALRERAKKSQEFTFFRPALVRARVRLAQME